MSSHITEAVTPSAAVLEALFASDSPALWVDTFCEHVPDSDPLLMRAWFANAMATAATIERQFQKNLTQQKAALA